MLMQFIRHGEAIHCVLVLALMCLLGCARTPEAPDWPIAFGYSSSEVVAIEIANFGYPYIPVAIGDDKMMLPFDTGNMVGVSLNTELFDQLGLSTVRTWSRVNGAGERVATLRVGEFRQVQVLGRNIGKKQIYERDLRSSPGLIGPADLGVRHFTLDYGSLRMAAGSTPLPENVPGYVAVPLVRSDRLPELILVYGSIEGDKVLMELDTGKSRTVINPDLAVKLGLTAVNRGVRIDRLEIGNLSFSVRSAKESDQTGIDLGIPKAIMAGVGSDVLSKFVWTVDYDAGVLWVPAVQ